MGEGGKKGKGGQGRAVKATPGRQEWVTTVECVSATGMALPPLVIFKAVRMHAEWVPCPLVHEWEWTTSNKGWTNATIA
jgi:hypothetical protein